MEDMELIRLIREDTSQGITEAMKLYGGAAKVICSSILTGCSREDLDEAVSDCFVALWRGIDHYDKERNVSLKSYFYGIARRTACNKKRVLMKKGTLENIDNVEAISEHNVEREVLEKMNYQLLRDCVLHMKSPDKEIFTYRYFEQSPIKEIAERYYLWMGP